MQCPIHLHAQKHPGRLALIRHDKAFSWRECDEYIDRIPELRLFKDLRAKKPYCPLNPYLPQKVQDDHKKCLRQISGFAACLYTSGSTTFPKIACFSYENLFWSALGSNISIPFEGNDRWLLSLPLYHVGGIGILMRWALSGALIVIPKKGKETKALNKHKVTHASYVPTTLKREKRSHLEKLKVILLGGAPLPEIDLPNLYPTYGLTEMSSQVMTRGQLLEYRQMKIAPDGEILVKGPTLFQGYFQDGRIHLPLDEDGYFHTNDLFDGQKILGRKDRQFISGGENIRPEEIETILMQFPEIDKAIVSPVADEDYGMRPKAHLILNHSIEINALKEALKKLLPSYKIPVSFSSSNQEEKATKSSWKS